MEAIRSYLETNRRRFIDELFSFLRIPSVSPGEDHEEENRRAAERLKELLSSAGMDGARLIETGTNPLVYAEHIESPDLPTLLIYGHYDVMPAAIEDGWSSEPFEPELRDGRVYARGAEDNKGQIFIQVKALEYLLAARPVNCNIKVIYEGEEEMGSPRFRKALPSLGELLSADGALICDTDMIDADTPSLITGLRGMAAVELNLDGPAQDLHSGMFGGAVTNPANALTGILAALTDGRGRIAVPEFYRDVVDYDPQQRGKIARMPFDRGDFMAEVGVEDMSGEAGFTDLERKTIRPSMDINGISTGYTGPGLKAIIPGSATAKLSFRLVPDQDPGHIIRQFSEYVQSLVPPGVKLTVTVIGEAPGFVCSDDNPSIRAAHRACRQVFGRDPVHIYEGGAIPVVPAFKEHLEIDSALLGFGLPTDNIHGPDENFRLEQTWKGIETVIAFVRAFAGS
jgi:acetylornithine deacetylase/succinyl-diaminopimelate desuccinylase-like protein